MKKYIQAARIRTLPLSLSGIILGSFIARSENTLFWSLDIFLVACLTTVLFQILSNFANDYGDGVKGTDNDQRIGPERAIQSGLISIKEMKYAIIITAILAFISACVLIILSFSINDYIFVILYLLLGVLCIVAAIKYTVGSNAYGYRALGDLFVFIFFGLVGVVGSYFLHENHNSLYIFIPASIIGLWSIAVLNLNNMRDRISDEASNKTTLVVLIGHDLAVVYHFFLIIMPFILLNIYILFLENYNLLWSLLGVIPFSLHLKKVWNCTDPKELDSELKVVALLTFFMAIFIGVLINL